MDNNALIEGIKKGDTRALSKAITLVESKNIIHQKQADKLIDEIYPFTGGSIRIGITGPPGVGKSTLIDKLGKLIAGEGKKLAILAIDPSSQISKGSILGDKIRMTSLTPLANVFIRPSATSSSLGGVTFNTREAILLCEAAGYEIVIVETVGVGQSEVNITNMVDIVVLIQIPGAGDELQGIKKGIIEVADIIAINKAEENNLERAESSKTAILQATSIIRQKHRGWQTPVLLTSANNNTGVEILLACVYKFYNFLIDNNHFYSNRRRQDIKWLDDIIDTKLKELFFNNKNIKEMYSALKKDIGEGNIYPKTAGRKLFEYF
jgi:LAO/AO transport system kinase